MNKRARQMRYTLTSVVVLVALVAMFPVSAFACGHYITNWGSTANCEGATLSGDYNYCGSVWVTWKVTLYHYTGSGPGSWYKSFSQDGFWADGHFEKGFTWPDSVDPGTYCVKIKAWEGGSSDTSYEKMYCGIDIPCPGPTAVCLASFEATATAQSVALSWETASEIDNLGFNLYRGDAADGPWTQLNADLIPSLVPPGSPVGATYTYEDGGLQAGMTYYYRLEAVDVYGQSEFYGPVSAALQLAQRSPIRPRLNPGPTK
jgi:hypothetical protein